MLVYRTIFKPPPTRVYDFTKMTDAQAERELARTCAEVDNLAARVDNIEDQLVVQAYRGI